MQYCFGVICFPSGIYFYLLRFRVVFLAKSKILNCKCWSDFLCVNSSVGTGRPENSALPTLRERGYRRQIKSNRTHWRSCSQRRMRRKWRRWRRRVGQHAAACKSSGSDCMGRWLSSSSLTCLPPNSAPKRHCPGQQSSNLHLCPTAIPKPIARGGGRS